MKYLLTIRLEGIDMTFECDRYSIQSNGVALLRKKERISLILRSDEEYQTVRFIPFTHMLYFDIEEREA